MDFFERLASHFHEKLPFVAYRKPKEDRVNAILQKDDQLHHLKTYTETGFIFAPFDTKEPTTILRPDELMNASSSDFHPEMPKKHSFALPVDTENKESHIKLVEKGIEEIGKGTFDKVVLSRCLKVDSNVLPLPLFKRLLTKYPNALCYMWYHPEVGLWLGATPEILLMLKNRQFTTMSLAGTQEYNGTETVDWGQKEVEEQQLVTDYIADALRNKIESLDKTGVQTVRAGNLLHLRTKITGRAKIIDLEDVIRALHPTPAVCGIPKESAMKFIRTNERYGREYYSGFLGELNLKTETQRSSRRQNQENQAYRSIAKTTTLYVNLRCTQLKEGKALVYVGGGITKDSDAEREWEETVAKSGTMLSILRYS